MSRSGSHHDRHFGTGLLRGDLRRRTVRGGVVAVAGHGARVALMLGSTMVLARLLRPEDFGLIAMVKALIGFSIMFRDFGLSSATVQKEEIDHEQVSTLFWVNLGISAVIALAIAALAPAIAWFYDEPVLVRVTLVLATISVFDGLAIQHQALLRRNMRFTALAGVELVSTSTGVIVALTLAWLGAGYWSLVALNVVTMGTRTLSVWLVSGWRPAAAVSLSRVRPMLAFGRNITTARMAHYLTRNVDKILIGKFWSAQQLGFYAKADNGIVMPFQQGGQTLSRVAVPTLSRLQNDPTRYRNYYRTAVLLVATAGFPAVVFMAVDAGAVVRLVLGGQWLDTVPILRMLAPVAVAGMVHMSTRWVFVSLGHTARLARWRVIESSLTIAGLAIGVRWGAMGVAASLAITATALIFPGLIYCFRRSPLGVGDVTAGAWRPLLAAVASGAGLVGLHALDLGASPLVTLAVDAPVYVALYLGVWMLLPRGRATLSKILQLAKELRP